ncbi:hypothetical protein QPK24_06455 [Paenibacillus polygoni]|uniref:Uncharacterized protein n=1 Tax=Paenibacillus polygoni TaxID=3050112 RepID=A0ABY8X472_9BACL|nr:hypothetical protein [Paenibacillus polygoni]WIV20331.1 hypothetical protein QPK24_06455 [Paenibacillus polygoni]
MLITKNNRIDDAISSHTFQVQTDLVELESTIHYQMEQGWNDDNVVLEKMEDIREELNSFTKLGQSLGRLTKEQERELSILYNYVSKYPDYTGVPNTILSSADRKKIEVLASNLPKAGWGMNISFSGDWDSFSEKLNKLLKQSTH